MLSTVNSQLPGMITGWTTPENKKLCFKQTGTKITEKPEKRVTVFLSLISLMPCVQRACWRMSHKHKYWHVLCGHD